MIISPAMMKIFEECQQKYIFIYVDKINLPQNKYFYEKGKNIHAMANYFIKGYDTSKLENALNTTEKEIWNYLKSTEYFKYEFVKSEYQLSSKLEESWIGGRLDALVKQGENYYILDYKTGSAPENAEFDYQTMVYLLCVDKYLKNYESLKFVYLDLKNKEEKVIEFSEKLKNEYENRIKNTLSKMKSVENSNEKLLKNNKCICDYYCICQKI